MITRSKFVAAVLGLAVAVAAIGAASAKTVIKSAAAQKVTRVHVAEHPVIAHARIVRHVKLLHRAPSRAKVVAKVIAKTRRAHIVERPLLQKQAMAHRTIVRKTIIR